MVIAATADGHTPKLLISEPCAKGLTGCDVNGQGRRGFRLLQNGAESLEAVYDARGVTFMDMDEDVRRLYLVSAREHNTPVPNRGRLMLSYRERERRVMVQ